MCRAVIGKHKARDRSRPRSRRPDHLQQLLQPLAPPARSGCYATASLMVRPKYPGPRSIQTPFQNRHPDHLHFCSGRPDGRAWRLVSAENQRSCCLTFGGRALSREASARMARCLGLLGIFLLGEGQLAELGCVAVVPRCWGALPVGGKTLAKSSEKPGGMVPVTAKTSPHSLTHSLTKQRKRENERKTSACETSFKKAWLA